MFKLYLLGMSPTGPDREQERVLSSCPSVVLPSRFRRLPQLRGKKLLAMTPFYSMPATLEKLLTEGDVAVLAGGDPLFFGVGRRILEVFGPEIVEILPGVSSIQLAFARFKEPWDDAVCISLHGRRLKGPDRLVLPGRKVFVLTDRHNTPGRLAALLQEYLSGLGLDDLAGSCAVMVGENLGLDGERLTRGSLAEVSCRDFADLSVMILKWPPSGGETLFPLGLGEDEICHSRGLITKNEVRAATLHALRLPRTGVLWDIGAGSGSVSIEAAGICPLLDVYAVERNGREVNNIKTNIRCRTVANVRIVEGEAPAVLAGLPAPDRVFVGGGGGMLAGIIRHAARELSEGGRIVVNGVLARTRELAPALLYDCGFTVQISEVSVRRRHYPPLDDEPHVFNTIAIITGAK